MFAARFGHVSKALLGAAVVAGMANPVYAHSLPLVVSQNVVVVSGDGSESPQELFEGATRMAMKALELLIRTLPQYEAPVVLKNGDILIRRKRAAPPSAPQEGDIPDRERI